MAKSSRSSAARKTNAASAKPRKSAPSRPSGAAPAAPARAARRRVHYVLSTHWDREWYQSFQDYRYQLVELWDHVLEGIQSGELRGPFQTDGQTIIVEDYLEIRPEKRAEIQKLARKGKLILGPWYTLPDEFLVSGESIVRNIRHGREYARTFGVEPSKAGWVCDLFGHCSQLPQIMKGFGIVGAFIWRGKVVDLARTRHFNWKGADGTTIPCYHFPRIGYCDYGITVRKLHAYDEQLTREGYLKDLDAYLDRENAATQLSPILLFDGGDHQEWERKAYGYLVERMKDSTYPFEIVHSSLDGYLDEMLAEAGKISETATGELRDTGRPPGTVDDQWLIPGVASSRVWIKQWNARCQTLLCAWAEPFSALATGALAREYPQGFLDVAWKHLLQNHPHDSICGCSIDVVHENMKFRFSQTELIADRLTREATLAVAAQVEGDVTADEVRVGLFNPLAHDFDGVTELTVQLPHDWPVFNEFFGFEPKPAFTIHDIDGREIPYQRLAQAMNRTHGRLHRTRFGQGFKTNDVTISLPVHVPALGYATLTVRKGIAFHKPTRYDERPGIATSPSTLENEFIAARVECNGTLTLTDKSTGNRYTGLLTFEDCADIGDGWYHGPAVNDQVFSSIAAPADIAIVHNGNNVATLRVRTRMNVPRRFDFSTMTRTSNDLVELVIDSTITLRKDASRLEIATTVHNTAEDHRLRVLLPSGAAGAVTYLADTPFDVVERPIALPADNHTYKELVVETTSQQQWTAVTDEERGLAVVSEGLMESCVRDTPQRPIALTLFRSTRRTVMTDGEPNGQLLGRLDFRYWVVPCAGAPDRAGLFEDAQELAGGLRAVYLQPADQALYRRDPAKQLPVSGGLASVDGPVVLTSARMVGGALEVRVFNPDTRRATATLKLGALAPAATKATSVDFESKPLGALAAPRKGAVTLVLAPKQILTVRLEA